LRQNKQNVFIKVVNKFIYVCLFLSVDFFLQFLSTINDKFCITLDFLQKKVDTFIVQARIFADPCKATCMFVLYHNIMLRLTAHLCIIALRISTKKCVGVELIKS
jgi:hypothetical protein